MSNDKNALASLKAAFPGDAPSLRLNTVSGLRGPLATKSEVPIDSTDVFVADFVAHKPLKRAHKDVIGYYRVQAKHARHIPVSHEFIGVNQWVRLPLPATAKRWTRTTRIGVVQAADHLLRNVKEAAHKYDKRLDFAIKRVDVITPARFHGARFAAAALYLLFDSETAVEARGYVAEGGGAFGRPQALYLGPQMGETAGDSCRFVFTAMADVDHAYDFVMNVDGTHPTKMVLKAFMGPERKQQYLTNTITFHPVTSESLDETGVYTPQSMQRVAANRVVQIGDAIVAAKKPGWIEHEDDLVATRVFSKLFPAKPTWTDTP
ncbi:MAG: hypothetical protein KDA24_06305 [Deltaproteobacteria bacterium]|nr:hypothetical protein [Deltaproteobacteria bacterium]